MAATMKRMAMMIIAYIFSCLLLSSTYCSPTPTATTAKVESDIPVETLDSFKNEIIEQLEEEFKHIGDKNINDINQVIRDFKTKRADEYRNRNYSKHELKHEDTSSEGDDGGDNDTPNNTVVTTIFIVATETPTNIYSGNGGNAAKQQGGTKKHQMSDPNSAYDSNSPTETEIAEQILQDQSAYHKLVTALSIVGGIAGIALITAGFIYTRIRIRKKKRLDLEKADSMNFSTPSTASFQHHSRPPFPPPSNGRMSSISFDDVNTTIIGHNQPLNPFADSNSIHSYRSVQSDSLLPPLLPVHFEPRSYITYRQDQTLSMLSLTTATVVPSAPTAKEIGVIRHENPFIDEEYGICDPTSEEEYNQQQQHQSQHQPCQSIDATSTNHVLEHGDQETTRNISVQVETQHPILLRQQALQKSESSFSSFPPPPAYTPNVAPSAPPLYALPIATTTFEDQQEDTLRRHSLSSCSIASTSSLPLSLRRGSDSLAHISSSLT